MRLNKRLSVMIGMVLLLLLNTAIQVIAATETVYQIELNVDKDANVTLGDIRVSKDYATDDSYVDKTSPYVFKASIFSTTGSLLSEIYFNPSFVVFTDPPTILDETFHTLNLPYLSDAKYLKIFFNNTEKLSVEIKDSICNNDNTCNNYESYYSCPNDCNICAKDNICASKSWDGCCDEDCFYDKDCEAITNDDDEDGILNENDLCPGTNPAASLITDDGCSCEQIKEAISTRGEGYAEGVLSDKNLGICRAAEAGAKGILAKTGRAFGFGETSGAGIYAITAVIILLSVIYLLARRKK